MKLIFCIVNMMAFFSSFSLVAMQQEEYRSKEEKFNLFEILGCTYHDEIYWSPNLVSSDYAYFGENGIKLANALIALLPEHVPTSRQIVISVDEEFFLVHQLPNLGLDLVLVDYVSEDDAVSTLDNLSIKKHPMIDGYGLYAVNPIRDGDVVGQYVGEAIYPRNDGRHTGRVLRYAKAVADVNEIISKNDDETFFIDLGCSHPYFYSNEVTGVPSNMFVDAKHIRNELAFANNASPHRANVKPTKALRIKVIYDKDGENVTISPSVILRAIKDIAAGDEILYDYGYSELITKTLEINLIDLRPEGYDACFSCGAKKWQRCNQCYVARYCSRECLRKDWPYHKHLCKKK